MKTNVVLAGWGQVSQPKELMTIPESPMDMMVRASETAALMLKRPDCLAEVEGIFTVKSLSAHYEDPARELADRLGANPGFTFESRIGGNSPQTLINKAGAMIARKELNLVLVAGAEAYIPRSDTEQQTDCALLQGIPEGYKGDDASGVTPLEIQYGIEHPMQGFPLFETALWSASGLEIDDYMTQVARFWSRFSQTAAAHPHSWTKKPKQPEEILTPSPRNRPIAFPYNKFMTSFVTVDMGAAVILMSEEYAGRLGTGNRRPVYLCGGGYAQDRQQFMIDKSDFTSSPPLKAAVDKALHRSGLGLGDMDCFDIYSCFPSAVSIARKMLDLDPEDPRPLTLTGGLGFFGGPGNNYNLHAVVTLCDRIASGLATTGMTTALGWFMHKHAAGIYSSLPPKKSIGTMDIEDKTDFLAGPIPVETDPAPSGKGVVETYTIVHNRDQSVAYAVVYGKTEKGLRFIARTENSRAVYQTLATRCMVGKTVALGKDPNTALTIARLD